MTVSTRSSLIFSTVVVKFVSRSMFKLVLDKLVSLIYLALLFYIWLEIRYSDVVKLVNLSDFQAVTTNKNNTKIFYDGVESKFTISTKSL